MGYHGIWHFPLLSASGLAQLQKACEGVVLGEWQL
jgi:hypothetical protein